MRINGRLTTWNDEKGYGFITPSAGGKRVFVHINAFANRGRRPEINQTVTFNVSCDPQGRPRAVHATLAGDRLAPSKRGSKSRLPFIAAACFLVLVGVSALTSRFPPLVFGFYIAASLVTFIAYAADKSAARKGRWRTPEKTLHILSLAGGWPGALVAQQVLRHKSRKQSFRAVFLVTAVLNCGVFVWLLSPPGAAALQSFAARAAEVLSMGAR